MPMASESTTTATSPQGADASSPRPAGIAFIPLVCMTAALFLTLRNMPVMAQTGMQMFAFNIIAVFAFLIPAALVAAELGTGWSKSGVFGWVEAAFGTRPALVATWLQWTQSLFGLTSILAYAAGTAAYVFKPELGDNPYFVGLSIIAIYWIATLANFGGAENSSKISTFCLIAGVVTPSLILAGVGGWWAASGNSDHFDTSTPLIPDLGNQATLLLFLSFVFGFVGIEVSASNLKYVRNPQKSYPRALFLASIIGFVVTLLGALAIALIIPSNRIDTINGAIQALSTAFSSLGISWATPIIAALIAIGAIGQVSTWIVGPVQGLSVAVDRGFLPPTFAHKNKNDVPTRLLIAQATCISMVGCVFFTGISVGTAFLVLTSIAVILYSVMYLLMFASAIKLRIQQPEVHRSYSVPGGIWGLSAVAGLGALTMLACLIIGFIAPTPNPLETEAMYAVVILIVVCAVTAVPLLAKKIWAARD